ncbi:restriction endonuclease [Rhizobium sp. IY2]|uniref:restriction endonuclease n=1 Tax=Rhizobium sp. IY2 TaxID=3397853 RepID=UPI0039DF895C
MPPWRTYQTDVARYLTELGFSVEVEKEVVGARGVHEVDVAAKTELFGVPVLWIAECKLWNAAVKKEQVTSLYQIAQDVGADRAFLLSESGFQSGAIRMAQNTNVTLTSLPDLIDHGRDSLTETRFHRINRVVGAVRSQLHPILWTVQDATPNRKLIPLFDTVTELLGACFGAQLAVAKALNDDFPVSFHGLPDDSVESVFHDKVTLVDRMTLDMQTVAERAIELNALWESANTFES